MDSGIALKQAASNCRQPDFFERGNDRAATRTAIFFFLYRAWSGYGYDAPAVQFSQLDPGIRACQTAPVGGALNRGDFSLGFAFTAQQDLAKAALNTKIKSGSICGAAAAESR